ncbi:MAG: hypothetical protein J6S06_03705 [Alphaproteobacteria bacterium]|nr:hypothetical protein [Alphaproteobacteria bacterium]
MKKIIFAFLFSCLFCVAFADTAPAPRISIFSTSTDWSAVTGLPLNEYHGTFTGKNSIIGRGMTVYYLDGFPCYGLGEGVRAWIDSRGNSHDHLRLACVAMPETIQFAWRNSSRDADDETTTGIIICPVDGDGRDFVIDLSDCKQGPDWDEYK